MKSFTNHGTKWIFNQLLHILVILKDRKIHQNFPNPIKSILLENLKVKDTTLRKLTNKLEKSKFNSIKTTIKYSKRAHCKRSFNRKSKNSINVDKNYMFHWVILSTSNHSSKYQNQGVHKDNKGHMKA